MREDNANENGTPQTGPAQPGAVAPVDNPRSDSEASLEASAPGANTSAGASQPSTSRLSSPRSNTFKPATQSKREASQKKGCNCKNSRCLKLYCECFAAGKYCESCNCLSCYNTAEHEAVRQQAIKATLERNPHAFRPKFRIDVDGEETHKKGCHCKKSHCLKKYCECFQAGVYCGETCKCLNCKNFEGSPDRPGSTSEAATVHKKRVDATRQGSVDSTVDRNPGTFRPKLRQVCAS